MAVRRYHDFIIEADDVRREENQNRTFAVRVFDSPAGQGEKEERVTIPTDLDPLCSALARRELDEDIDLQIELGMKLAGLLLPDYARSLYQRSLDLVTQREEGLRLRLHLDDALTDYPWEFAYIQKSRGEHVETDFLALDPRLSMVRHERLAQPVPGDWAESPRKRRILVAMASPEGEGWKKLPHLLDEQRALKAELDGATGLEVAYLPREYGDISPDEMDSATVEDLARALMERTDVFHFSGHGDFIDRPGPAIDKVVGQGVVILANEENQPVPFPAAELGKMLTSKGVRLAVLGACESARTGYRVDSHIWGGVAVSLLREGIPAVVAMQYVVNDRLTAAFMGAFYRALVAGYLVDEAVALGRAAVRRKARLRMKRPHMRDWGVPVLYNRAPDGRVFYPVSDEAGRARAEETLEDLVHQEFGTLTERSVTVGAIDSQSATVEQKVHEESRGILIGGVFREESESMKKIVQEIAVASGLTIGSYTGDAEHLREFTDVLSSLRLGSSLGRAAAETQPASGTTTSPAGGTGESESSPASSGGLTCPTCGRAVEADWTVCAYCRTEL